MFFTSTSFPMNECFIQMTRFRDFSSCGHESADPQLISAREPPEVREIRFGTFYLDILWLETEPGIRRCKCADIEGRLTTEMSVYMGRWKHRWHMMIAVGCFQSMGQVDSINPFGKFSTGRSKLPILPPINL